VSDADSVQACIDGVIAEHGKIDNLVTSAGFTENFQAIDYPIERMRKLWSVNVDGTYLFAVAVAKHLMARESPGSMVFIGSMSGSIVNIPQPQAYVRSSYELQWKQTANETLGIADLTTAPKQLFGTWQPRSLWNGHALEFESTASHLVTC
jgi:hypothetical protein